MNRSFFSTLLYSADLWPLSATQTKKLEAARHKFQRRLLGISWKDKVKNDDIMQKENGLQETRRHNQRTKTKMVGTCHANGGLQNTSPGYTQWEMKGYKRKPGRAWTTKDKLDGHREMQPEKHGHHHSPA